MKSGDAQRNVQKNTGIDNMEGSESEYLQYKRPAGMRNKTSRNEK